MKKITNLFVITVLLFISVASFAQVSYKSIQVDGLNIAYREAGNPASPKIVLLHGFPAGSHQYRDLIQSLSDKFHVIAPDYPGFGLSDMPDPATYNLFSCCLFFKVLLFIERKTNFCPALLYRTIIEFSRTLVNFLQANLHTAHNESFCRQICPLCILRSAFSKQKETFSFFC